MKPGGMSTSGSRGTGVTMYRPAAIANAGSPVQWCTPLNRSAGAQMRPARDSRTPAAAAEPPIPTMEEHVPRAPWRRRRTTDSPRPAGRRWAGRLRRSGTFARQVLLVRVGRRRRRVARGADRPSDAPAAERDASAVRVGLAPDRTGDRSVAPVSPAVGRHHAGRRVAGDGRSRCCPASAPPPAGSSSRWSTPAPWPAWCSACSPIFLAMHGEVRHRRRSA